MSSSSTTSTVDREAVLSSLMEKYGLDVSKKRRKNLLESDPVAFESYKAGIEIAHSCKTMDLDVAYNVYRKCKENEIPLTPNLYTNLLSLTAGLGDPGCGSLMRRSAPPKDYHKAMEIYTSIRQLNIVPAEAAFSALMRCCCSEGHKEQALELYEDMKRLGLEPKLRGVTALVAAFGAAGDTSTCFYLFDEMKTKLSIDPTEKEYYSLLQACAIAHDARFISVVDELMEDHLLLHDQETIDLIYQHLHEQYHFGQASSIVDASGALKDVTTDVASPLVLQSIDLNVQTRSGLLEQLQSFAIDRDPNQKHKLNNKVKDLVSLKPAAAAADTAPPSVATTADTAMVTVEEDTVKDTTNKNKDTTRKYVVLPKANEEKWTAFTSWLDKRYEAYPFDILVDGANVGYYKQNFPGAPNHIDYHQLHALIEALIRDHGRKPLLIIHSRHLADHMIPPQDPNVRSLIASWRERNIVYATPKGFNDDWFWLYTTVRFQLPVVTNDEMRDHHFKLLSPRYFMRWRERYRVCYDLFFARHDLRPQQQQQQQQHAEEDDDDSEEYDSDDDGEGEEGDGGGGGSGQPDTATASQAQGAATTTTTTPTTATDNGFSFHSNQVSKFSSACHRSRAKFFFPRKYSYRMQHIVREDVEAFCFPPLAPRYDNNLVDPEQGRQPKSDAEGGGGGGGGGDKDRSDGHHVKIDDRKPWVCLYRRK